jgi:hypothetical protein
MPLPERPSTLMKKLSYPSEDIMEESGGESRWLDFARLIVAYADEAILFIILAYVGYRLLT